VKPPPAAGRAARKQVRKLLVANRGEIALRIIRTARELGVATVAVFADQDCTALHVRAADEGHALDGRRPESTYLSPPKLIAAAKATGADAVHPGYGFLSEDAGFARAVGDAGLTFVGPPPDVLRLAGNKIEARKRATAAGVPVLPAASGSIHDLAAAAPHLGFPLLVKAAGGGGGRGMRRLTDTSRIDEILVSASREAEKFFGNGEVYIEREVQRARHVEFQVLGDAGGRIIELGDRECSIQRRHQKLIEESPSPALDEPLRQEMADAALSVARALGYENAGTVEFLLEVGEDGRPVAYYFLEVNARLQVEHPVTEVLWGQDLVAWQIRVASGEELPAALSRPETGWHAIECRLCAESPPAFLPSSGTLHVLEPPRGPGVRFDEGYAQGDVVPIEFDSLLGKAIAVGPDRAAALRRLEAALEAAVILGVDSNLDYLADVLRHPRFQAGAYTTRFLDEEMAAWTPTAPSQEVELIARKTLEQARPGRGAPARSQGPWSRLGEWRAGQA
jgi:acetyl/propionyl-CoA carboxylase alpha subunit